MRIRYGKSWTLLLAAAITNFYHFTLSFYVFHFLFVTIWLNSLSRLCFVPIFTNKQWRKLCWQKLCLWTMLAKQPRRCGMPTWNGTVDSSFRCLFYSMTIDHFRIVWRVILETNLIASKRGWGVQMKFCQQRLYGGLYKSSQICVFIYLHLNSETLIKQLVIVK